MLARKSCVFLTMPTSGTGSLWRIISAIAGDNYKLVKIAEDFEVAGKGALIPHWIPEPNGHIYMYNTPHYVNANFNDPELKLITHFRDPRDLSCNQFHWALQHPVLNRSDEDVAAMRRRVSEQGIDAFVLTRDNNILFKSLRALETRLQNDDPNILKSSYSQLCLDFDNLVEKIINFLEVSPETVPRDKLELERTVNLANNADWIGHVWTGTDVMPERYRKELRPETIAELDKRYRENLKFARSLELPAFRPFLATELERGEMDRVLVGKANQLFLRHDANNTLGQITGRVVLSFSHLTNIAITHHSRMHFGKTIGNFGYFHCIIPSKEVAHRALLPATVGFEEAGPRPFRQYLDAGLEQIWAPFYEAETLEPSSERQYFPVTDTHWNHDGALRYFTKFLESVSPELADALSTIPLRRFDSAQQGDLGLKMEMKPEPIEIVAPVRTQANLVFNNYIGNEGNVKWFSNPASVSPKRVVVMHDSFSLWLREFVHELFAEAVFFHGTVFDYDFIRALRPDLVLCIQAERFFPRIPENGKSIVEYVSREEHEKKAKFRLAEFLKSEPRFSASRNLT